LAQKAHVTSIDALDRFRSSLVVFVERVNSILDEVSEEVKRTRIWLQSEQRLRLDQQMKRRNRELDMLKQEMFTARLSNLTNAKTGQQLQINRKRREIRDIEDKMKALAAWLRNFDSTVETEARKVEKLRFLIDTDMKKAIRFLSETVRLLEEYSEAGGMPPAEESGDGSK
jgi:paraquat-inducible protein B